jgi:hypothetical protein
LGEGDKEIERTYPFYRRNFEETKRQIEDDGENEVEEMREMYELKLNTERQTALRLKGETNIMKKRFSTQQKEIDDYKEVIFLRQFFPRTCS